MRISVGIIENDGDVRVALARRIDNDRRFELSFILSDASKAVSYIKENAPDVLLLNNELPATTGVELLRKMRDEKIDKHPYVILSSSFCDNFFVGYAASVGASEFLSKPYDFDTVIDRLAFMHEYLNSAKRHKHKYEISEEDFNRNAVVREEYLVKFKQERNSVISGLCYEILCDSGFIANEKGFSYIIEAVKVLFCRKDMQMVITKELYPELSLAFVTNMTSIERNIRNSIKKAWERRLNKKSYIQTPNDIFNAFDTRPGNGELIKEVARKIKEILDDEKKYY